MIELPPYVSKQGSKRWCSFRLHNLRPNQCPLNIKQPTNQWCATLMVRWNISGQKRYKPGIEFLTSSVTSFHPVLVYSLSNFNSNMAQFQVNGFAIVVGVRNPETLPFKYSLSSAYRQQVELARRLSSVSPKRGPKASCLPTSTTRPPLKQLKPASL